MGTVETSQGAAPLDPVSQVEMQVAELERAVQNFEDTATLVERCVNDVEQLAKADGANEEASLQPFTRSLRASQEAAVLVHAANRTLNDALTQARPVEQIEFSEAGLAPLPIGTLICDGRYRLLQLLYARPRVHVYLARRLSNLPGMKSAAPSLVAIREIVLDGLAQDVRRNVVRSAFEEFAAPQLFGTPHLVGVGDYLYVEEGRHYLVMQPRPARSRTMAFAQPLSEILSNQPQGNAWPNLPGALFLATRLCQTVARLHGTKTFLGELTPELVLVDRFGSSSWSPLLLASWPPAPSFWPEDMSQETLQSYARTFPPVVSATTAVGNERPFAAPESFTGCCDERSDVYALGALLYLLLTGSAPMPASSRQRAASAQNARNARKERHTARRGRKNNSTARPDQQPEQSSALTPPRQLNARISPLLEQILLRALDLDPQQRFASAQDLAEALESMHLKGDISGTSAPFTQAKVSRLRKLLEWLRK